MPTTYRSRQLRIQREADRQLTAAHRQLACQIGGLILQAAHGVSATGTPIVPNLRSTRTALKSRIWTEAVKPFYVGSRDDAFLDGKPQSQYAQIVYTGIEGVTRVEAERQAGLVRRVVKDPVVLQWLTGPRRGLPFLQEMRVTELISLPVGGRVNAFCGALRRPTRCQRADQR